MLKLRRVVQPLVCFALVSCSLLTAGSQTPAPRIRERITDGNRVALPGSRSPLADIGQDLGALPGDKTLQGITLVFKRSAAQQADLDQLLTAQQDTKSPLYHHWLTPNAFAARFGMAESDLAAAADWLTQHGLRVEDVPSSHDRIRFGGTARQLHDALGANIHLFRVGQDQVFAPTADLSLPGELTSVLAGVGHLTSLRPHPALKAPVKPAYTDATSGAHLLVPLDLPAMYNAGSLAETLNGAGQAIALVGQSYISDRASNGGGVIQQYLGSKGATGYVFVPGSGVQVITPGDEAESDIDLEYVSALAQSASVYLVYVGDNENYSVFDSIQYAITTNLAPVISISYGVCEALLSPGDLDQQNAIFMQAAAQGQTVIASSGDSGSTDCAGFTTAQGVSPSLQQALSVSFPASSPFVTALGGLQMAPGTFDAGPNQYWSSGSAQGPFQSLLSYVPEIAWNEDSTGNTPFAGGGGASAHFPRPTWQNVFPGMPTGTARLIPDLSLQASADHPGFAFCTADFSFYASEGGTDASCSQGLADRHGLYTRGGGTSFAAPVFAGLVAVLNQSSGSTGQGNLNPTLYDLASDPATYAGAFHDITAGSIACTPGVTNCGPDGQSGFAAVAGFDQATGLGSLDATKLVAAWPRASVAASSLQPTTVQTSLQSLSYTDAADPGETLPMNITVAVGGNVASPTPPTGSVSVEIDGLPVSVVSPLGNPSTTMFTSSSVTYTLTAPTTAGTHVIVVSYPGDATHMASRATQPLMVGSVTPSGSIQLSASNLTLAPNAKGTIPIVVTPSAGYHGRLYWNLSVASGAGQLTGCYSIAPLLVSSTGTSSATLTLGVGQACSQGISSNQRPLTGSKAVLESPQGPRLAPAASFAACLLLCGTLVRKRKTVAGGTLLTLLLASAWSSSLLGCGGSSRTVSPTPPIASNPPSPTPTPNASTYTFTLYGSDTVNPGVNATTSFTLTVSQ